jgi:hypothetical protein
MQTSLAARSLARHRAAGGPAARQGRLRGLPCWRPFRSMPPGASPRGKRACGPRRPPARPGAGGSLRRHTTIQIPFPANPLAARGLRPRSRLEPTPSPAPGTAQPAERVSWPQAPRGACIRRMPGASAYVNGIVRRQASRAAGPPGAAFSRQPRDLYTALLFSALMIDSSRAIVYTRSRQNGEVRDAVSQCD